MTESGRYDTIGPSVKAYLITTGAIFGIVAPLHVWRAVAEWPHSTPFALFLLGMGALVVIPTTLSAWASALLRKLPRA